MVWDGVDACGGGVLVLVLGEFASDPKIGVPH